MSREIDEHDPDESLKAFVKSAETTMDLAASATEHAQMGDCRNASRFAFRASEEIGAVRGVMGQVATEIRLTKNEEEKKRLQKTLEIMRDDFAVIEQARTGMFQNTSRCFGGAPIPFAVTTRPADGEEDG
jgi:hypothetical protein